VRDRPGARNLHGASQTRTSLKSRDVKGPSQRTRWRGGASLACCAQSTSCGRRRAPDMDCQPEGSAVNCNLTRGRHSPSTDRCGMAGACGWVDHWASSNESTTPSAKAVCCEPGSGSEDKVEKTAASARKDRYVAVGRSGFDADGCEQQNGRAKKQRRACAK